MPERVAKTARLHLFADVDVKKLSLNDLKQGNVGHTWVSLEYKDPAKVPDDVHATHKPLLQTGGRFSDPMGFWPDIHGYNAPDHQRVGYSTNPFKSYVQGWMSHPDRAHEGAVKASQTWDITDAQVNNVIRYAESKRSARYSVFFYNCSTFGKESVEAAGESPPSMSSGGVCFQNALYDGIKARNDKGVGNTTVTDLDTNVDKTVEGPSPGKRG